MALIISPVLVQYILNLFCYIFKENFHLQRFNELIKRYNLISSPIYHPIDPVHHGLKKIAVFLLISKLWYKCFILDQFILQRFFSVMLPLLQSEWHISKCPFWSDLIESLKLRVFSFFVLDECSENFYVQLSYISQQYLSDSKSSPSIHGSI
jgi:hypothetical protein